MHKSASMFLNRELSWLEFNQRVLEEARDPDVPLLERLNFLGITASNLDEFFMVRVGGLELLIAADVNRPDPTGLIPARQLACVSARVAVMVRDQYALYLEGLQPALHRAGIVRLMVDGLDADQREHARQHFHQTVFPVVTPMCVPEGSSFPLLPNLGLNLAVRLHAPRSKGKTAFAVIPLGSSLARFVAVPSEAAFAYVLMEDLLSALAGEFFPGETVVETAAFRITRNADLSAREDDAADFLSEMESVLKERKASGCVRLEVAAGASRTLTAFLRKALDARETQVYHVPGPLDLAGLRGLASLHGFDGLKYKPWPPRRTPGLDPRRTIFEELARRNVLLSLPYDSFEPVVRLVEEAAADPDVLAIKQILYRTSADSPIVAALRKAAERGKYVTVIVELKARFDEARNIEWARALEQAGVQVIYGIRGLKTHAKLCIVIRREARGVVRYLHFGTGNYNERTARLYTDIGYMTADEELGVDASAFFNSISGYSVPPNFRKLEASPGGLRRKLSELIEGEIQRQRGGQKGLIMAKMNALVDPGIISSLYRASKAGVTVLLNVRGTCCLRPAVPGLSETITVVSIVDRFLEHSRIFYFHQGGEQRVFISSADWMPRNLDRRIELIVPVEDPQARDALVRLLRTCFADNVKAWELRPDGTYVRLRHGRKKAVRSQEALYREARVAAREAERAKPTVFQPHRPPNDEL